MKKDLVPALRDGRVAEIFCTGTGALVVPVEGLSFPGEFLCISGPEQQGSSKQAYRNDSFAESIKQDILDIQMGLVPGHPFVVEC